MTTTEIEFRAPEAPTDDTPALRASIRAAMPGILEAAARLVDNGGWIQGWNRRGDCFCAMGAVFEASGYVRWEACTCPDGDYAAIAPPAAQDALTEATHDAMRLPDHVSVFAWNDHPRRTAAEVVTRLREAAEVARGWSE